jgi:hypothetical protein
MGAEEKEGGRRDLRRERVDENYRDFVKSDKI